MKGKKTLVYKQIGIKSEEKKVYVGTLQELELVSESNYIFQGRCQQIYKSSFDKINNNVFRYVNE